MRSIFRKVLPILIMICAFGAVFWSQSELLRSGRSHQRERQIEARREIKSEDYQDGLCQNLESFFSKVMYLPTETQAAKGMEITALAKDVWLAKHLALQVGDIITGINGQKLKGNINEFDRTTEALCGLRKSKKIALDLLRGNTRHRIQIQLAHPSTNL